MAQSAQSVLALLLVVAVSCVFAGACRVLIFIVSLNFQDCSFVAAISQCVLNILLSLPARPPVHRSFACNISLPPAPQTHINIGFNQGDNTVVAAGLVAARYQPGSPTPTTVDRFFPWLDLYITLTGGFGNSSQDYVVSVSNSNTTLETASVDRTSWPMLGFLRPRRVRELAICEYLLSVASSAVAALARAHCICFSVQTPSQSSLHLAP